MYYKYFECCKPENCNRRTTTCHSTCKDYKVAKIMAARDKAREKTKKKKEKELREYKHDGISKVFHRKNQLKRK